MENDVETHRSPIASADFPRSSINSRRGRTQAGVLKIMIEHFVLSTWIPRGICRLDWPGTSSLVSTKELDLRQHQQHPGTSHDSAGDNLKRSLVLEKLAYKSR